MTPTLTLNLADVLGRKFPNGFRVPADIDIDRLLSGGDDWGHALDLDALLAADDRVALVWSAGDVLTRRPDLTPEQAWRVLTATRDDFRRDGRHRDFIESTADGLFPVGAEARDRLLRRIASLLNAVDALSDGGLTDPGRVAALTARLDDLEAALIDNTSIKTTTTTKGD